MPCASQKGQRTNGNSIANILSVSSYPEGQLNKNPRTIQPLRRGSFSLPIAHKKAIWGFLNVGCERAWPYKCAVGGFPSDIYVKVFKVTDDASKYNNIELADYAREVMQKNLDDMYAVFDGKKEE